MDVKDWSPLYNILSDPNEAVELLINNVTEAFDTVAPAKAIKIGHDKPKIISKQSWPIEMKPGRLVNLNVSKC